MANYEVLETGDTATLDEIMTTSYERLVMHVASMVNKPTPAELVMKSYCGTAAAITAKVAHEQGIFAGREIHEGHCITSFTPPRPEQSEADLIMCLTWGQFSWPDLIAGRCEALGLNPDYPGYVGVREGARELFHESQIYDECYSARSTCGIQTAYPEPPLSRVSESWVTYPPGAFVCGDAIAVGPVAAALYEDWIDIESHASPVNPLPGVGTLVI